MLNRLRNNSLIAVVIGLLLWIPLAGFGQIELNEAARSAKLTPDLLKLEVKDKANQQKRGNLRQAADEDTNPRLKLMQIFDGMVAIEAVSNEADAQGLLAALQAIGLTEGAYYKRIASGNFPISKLGDLKNIPSLHIARPIYKPLHRAGKVTSQGDKAMKADIARQTYNVTGAGSKIGILSDSYNALNGAAAGVASGDLPTGVQVIRDLADKDKPDGTDEGRAMAEIVHDVAPGAKIAFHTANYGEVDFALGILRLASIGCNIIVDDVFYYFEPFFQDGIIAQAVDYAKEKLNVSYFSSAGNDGNNSYTSSFHNSGKLPPGSDAYKLKGSAHDFGNGTILQKASVAPGSTMILIFQWSDPFYSQGAVDFSKGIENGIMGAKTDMDVLVYYKGVLMPEWSNVGYNNIGDDPIDFVYIPNETKQTIDIEIAFVKVDGPDPTLIKLVNFNNGDPGVRADFASNSSTVVGHANADGAIAVGAVRYDRTPVYNPDRYPIPVIESYSSSGGTPILFTEYGQLFPTRIRQKPEITAAHVGNTTFFFQGFDYENDGFPNFPGTSAAAPHAAAVAALLQEKAGFSMSPNDVKKRLEATAIDMDDPVTPGFDVGFDFRTGYGFVQADKALTFGQPLAVIEPLFDCQTRKITLRTTGGDGTPITFILPGVQRTSPTSTTGIVEAGVIAEGKPITIIAVQSGVTTTYTFDFVEYCLRPREFALIEPLYDCATGNITFRTVGGDGTTITYFAPGIQRSSPTDPNGTVEAGLRYDPRPLTITATQSGVTVSYTFNFVAYCSSRARVAANEPGTGLQVSVLGNPIAADWVEVEVKGVQGQPLKLRVNNTLGELTSNKAVDMAEATERHKVLLGRTPGLYLLQVSTPMQTKTIKIVRQ